MKLFVDANTLVSGLAFAGNERLLLELGRFRLCDLVANEYVFEEVRNVLARPHLGLSPDEQRRALAFLARYVAVLEDPSLEAVRAARGRLADDRDLPILLGFEQSGCGFLVTGDRALRERVPNAITTRTAIRKILKGVE